MKTSEEILNPPGGFLMWLIVLMETFMFGALIIIVARYRYLNLSDFKSESVHLHLRHGMIFTLSLLLSGFLAAEGVRFFFKNQRQQSLIYFILSFVFGLFFLIFKISDFAHKSELGFGVEKNDFWQYYWLLMGFHFLHVVVGVFILFSICLGIYRDKIEEPEFSVRGGVLFWHMCDIVWLVIFPLFYLGGTFHE
ncbi:cytochrome c oxidase subunit 3 [Bdellovibrio bacteriovorus]|uniref:cytochrome c oxidase subunit 3 n=1 Tax=Bdellovibrio bacteriovorus TaxID=959 RepID=UPI0035A8E79E